MTQPPPQMQTAPNRAKASDGMLLRRLQQGDGDVAAAALYRRYATRLRRLAKSQIGKDLASRFDADDVVQSIFRTFFRRVAAGHYDIPEGEELWKLFLVIGLNKIRTVAKYHRAAKRDVVRTEGIERIAALLVSPESQGQIAYQILSFTVDNLLESMPDSQQRMVMMRIEGWGMQHIAQQTQRSRRSVERVLQRFRDRLRDQLKGG